LKDGRGGEIRTHDLLDPNQARYQPTLRPDIGGMSLPAARLKSNAEIFDGWNIACVANISVK
jgi:hypothetical protein